MKSTQVNLFSLLSMLWNYDKFIKNNRKKYETSFPINLMLKIENEKINKFIRPIYKLIQRK